MYTFVNLLAACIAHDTFLFCHSFLDVIKSGYVLGGVNVISLHVALYVVVFAVTAELTLKLFCRILSA
jgi:hypothetical protein